MVIQKQTASLLNLNFHFFLPPQKLAATAPLPFLTLGSTPGVSKFALSQFDDGFSLSINITEGFLFGFNTETVLYVSIQTVSAEDQEAHVTG